MPHFDLEYAHMPQSSHATPVIAAQPVITSHARMNNENTFSVELKEVITEKSKLSSYGSLAYQGGDEEEFFDVDRQDISDDVDVEMLVVDHCSHH